MIWINKTGIILHYRRGRYKLWRLAQEKVNKLSIHPQFKKATAFIFWGAFLYN